MSDAQPLRALRRRIPLDSINAALLVGTEPKKKKKNQLIRLHGLRRDAGTFSDLQQGL